MDEEVLTRSEQKLSISKAGVEQVVPPSPAFALLPPSLPPLVLRLEPWTPPTLLQTLGTWQPHEAGNSVGGWDLDSPRRASKQPSRSMF